MAIDNASRIITGQLRTPIVLLLLASLVLLAACDLTTAPTPISRPTAPTAPTTAAGPQPPVKNPDTIVIASQSSGDVSTLDPAYAYDAGSGGIVFNIYETLVFLKRERVDEYVPMLASKWDITQDGKTYTFNIRTGIKFQGGEDLTPEDIAYSLWRVMVEDPSGGPGWLLLQPFFGLDVQRFKADVVDKQHGGDWVAGCQAIKQAVMFDNGAGTVTLHLKQPFGPTLQILAGSWASAVSKQWVSSHGGWNGDCATASKYNDRKPEETELYKTTNGTGPYKLERWTPGEEIDLVRNDDYWLKQPLWEGGPSGPAAVRRVVMKKVQEWGTRFSMLKAQDVDFASLGGDYVTQLDPLVKQQCDYLTGNCSPVHPDGFLSLYKGLPTNTANAIYLNQQVNADGGNAMIGSGKLDGNGAPPDFFADLHVRKAFNYCFDWDTYIKQALNGEAEQAYGPVIKGELGYDPNQPHYSYDPVRCAEEFKASTLKSPDGKSLWDAGFVLQFPYTPNNDLIQKQGDILRTSLSNVNPRFKLVLVQLPRPAMMKEYQASRIPMYSYGWVEDYHDPHDWALPYLGSGGYFAAFQHFPSGLQSQLDGLIAQGVQTIDLKGRAAIYDQLQKIAYEQALDIFTTQVQDRQYLPEWIKGWYYNPAYWGAYFYVLAKGQ